jgi:hypothetical protein
MQNETFYPTYSRINKTPVQVLGSLLYQGLILCIALPLALMVVAGRGIHQVFSFVAKLSFTCCVWIFLGAIMLLFLLAVTVQLAVASLG